MLTWHKRAKIINSANTDISIFHIGCIGANVIKAFYIFTGASSGFSWARCRTEKKNSNSFSRFPYHTLITVIYSAPFKRYIGYWGNVQNHISDTFFYAIEFLQNPKQFISHLSVEFHLCFLFCFLFFPPIHEAIGNGNNKFLVHKKGVKLSHSNIIYV